MSGKPEDFTEEDVAGYLRRNPGFFVKYPEFLEELTPPVRWDGDAVVDLNQVIVKHLRGEIDSLRNTALDLIEISRANMSSQTRTLAAALALLRAGDIEELLRVIGEEMPLILDVDVATVAFEPGQPPPAGLTSPHIGRLPGNGVNSFLGAGRNAVLMDDMLDDGTVFGAGAGLVRSAALARLQPGETTPPGLLALGSREATAFHPGLGSDLVAFLASVLEPCLHKLLEEPAPESGR
ncbi:MAG: DUF484 family protein [Rhodospirillales bacterium]|jgi:hypothetical protein|nr:DUF484 family protein [Rhodospirillales bacterium]MDP6773747.1 DUF484 family protein [Rhodospirillales bacterium]